MADEHEVAEISTFRVVTGWVGLVLLLGIAASMFLHRVDWSTDPFELILTAAAMAGWGGLVYACWIRSGQITDTALAFVLSVGVCGMAISLLALVGPDDYRRMAVVFLTGTWIMNGLGIVWIVHKVRRIRAASNTDEADAMR